MLQLRRLLAPLFALLDGDNEEHMALRGMDVEANRDRNISTINTTNNNESMEAIKLVAIMGK